MTLKDLKKRVPVADEKKVILRKKELLNTGAEIVVKEIIEDGVEISVYDNGYVLYEEGRARGTVAGVRALVCLWTGTVETERSEWKGLLSGTDP